MGSPPEMHGGLRRECRPWTCSRKFCRATLSPRCSASPRIGAVVDIAFDLRGRADANDAALTASVTLATAAAKRIAREGVQAGPPPEERDALDLFILLVSRPAMFVQNGRVSDRPENWPEVARDEELFPRSSPASGASRPPRTTSSDRVSRRRATRPHEQPRALRAVRLPLDHWRQQPAAFAKRCDERATQWTNAQTPHRSSKCAASLARRVVDGAVDPRARDIISRSTWRSSRSTPIRRAAASAVDGRGTGLVRWTARLCGRLSGRGRAKHVGSAHHADSRVPPRLRRRRESLGTKRFSPGTVLGWHDDQRVHARRVDAARQLRIVHRRFRRSPRHRARTSAAATSSRTTRSRSGKSATIRCSRTTASLRLKEHARPRHRHRHRRLHETRMAPDRRGARCDRVRAVGGHRGGSRSRRFDAAAVAAPPTIHHSRATARRPAARPIRPAASGRRRETPSYERSTPTRRQGQDADELWFYYGGHGLAAAGQGPQRGPGCTGRRFEDRLLHQPRAGRELDTSARDGGRATRRSSSTSSMPAGDVLPPAGRSKRLTQQLIWTTLRRGRRLVDAGGSFRDHRGSAGQGVARHGLFGRASSGGLRGLGPGTSARRRRQGRDSPARCRLHVQTPSSSSSRTSIGRCAERVCPTWERPDAMGIGRPVNASRRREATRRRRSSCGTISPPRR